MVVKNFSFQKIAFAVALLTVVLIIIVQYFSDLSFYLILTLAISAGISVYLLCYYLIRKFIDHRIRIIYKLISSTKTTKKEDFYFKHLLPKKTMDETDEDVQNWALNYHKEIDELRRNESYRKEFLMNLSHELKTPIFAAQSYVETLLEGAMANPEVSGNFLLKASKNINRLVRLVEDLDEITQLESGRLKLNKERFSAIELFREVFESLNFKARQKEISFKLLKEDGTSFMVFADKEKLRQVLVNLVDNAIKYGKQGGQIKGSIFGLETGKVLVEISDDGRGIKEEHLNRIFERFYRVAEPGQPRSEGSGLGLSIAKHIIEAHGGTIHVRSTYDIGSTFGFVLPE